MNETLDITHHNAIKWITACRKEDSHINEHYRDIINQVYFDKIQLTFWDKRSVITNSYLQLDGSKVIYLDSAYSTGKKATAHIKKFKVLEYFEKSVLVDIDLMVKCENRINTVLHIQGIRHIDYVRYNIINGMFLRVEE